MFWVRPGVVIIGLLSHNGRDSPETINVPPGLPVVQQFHVTDLRRAIHGTPLTVAPARCPARGAKFDFRVPVREWIRPGLGESPALRLARARPGS